MKCNRKIKIAYEKWNKPIGIGVICNLWKAIDYYDQINSP
jgi:hypothetical protein